MANKYKNKSLTYKKYFYAVIIILVIIFLALYFNKWHQVKEEEKYLTSYLISTNTISLEMTDINEISTVLSETPNYYFVYISYTKDKNVYQLEEDLKPLIDEYNLQNNFYFMNVTTIKEKESNYKEKIAQELKMNSSNINTVPIILYFKDGNFVSSVTNANDFKTLLEEQDIKAM